METNKIANKSVICKVLMNAAENDKDIVALCSDSRGSGSFAPFAEKYPEQFVETGIAEQNLVSIVAGLAKCGKNHMRYRPHAFCQQGAMNSVRLTRHIQTQMLN